MRSDPLYLTRGDALLDVGRLITACADLAEAEGKLLRAHLVRLALAAALGAAALLTALAGIALLFTGLFLLLEPAAGSGGASLICGGLLIACSVVIAWLIKMRNPA